MSAPAVAWCGPGGVPLAVDRAVRDPAGALVDGVLHDGERRWPVVAGIPWLRAGRDDVRERAVAALDAGDAEGAAVVLLADADDWWDAPPPPDAQLRAALRATTLRAAVDLLGLGRVGTYFLHRWSDPSWLAALALTAAHPPAGRPVVDLACGAGHLLRHLALHGHGAAPGGLTGIDVVFAKLWLARRFVLPPAVPVALVCADLTAPWPLPDPDGPGSTGARHVSCHDALYFFDDADKVALVAAARRHAGAGGAVLLGHCHNARHPAGRAGRPLDPDGWRALLPGAVAYAEEELTAATVAVRPPRPAADPTGPTGLVGPTDPARGTGRGTGTDPTGGGTRTGHLGGGTRTAGPGLDATEAVNLALDLASAPPDPALLGPAAGVPLRPNPLYGDPAGDGARRWPGDRWAAEYGARAATYLPERRTDPPADSAVRRRLLLDLPESW